VGRVEEAMAGLKAARGSVAGALAAGASAAEARAAEAMEGAD
jgi:hypothetical protein